MGNSIAVLRPKGELLYSAVAAEDAAAVQVPNAGVLQRAVR
jgi:hypothetical protein